MASDAPQQMEIESADIIRLILQFLKENNLNRTMMSLQEESRVALGAVESLDQYSSDIMHGRWANVLQTAGCMAYPEETLHLLYEQVICEFAELGEFNAAIKLMKETSAAQSLKLVHPDRYRRLDQICSRKLSDPRELYEGSSREKRRAVVSEALLKDVSQAVPSRLLGLVGMAIKWQHQQGLLPVGTKFDLFRGTAVATKDQADECVTHATKSLKFGVKSHPQCAVFSPDGQFLITGSVDGFIEVMDAVTGTLRSDLAYQAQDMLMMHDKAIMALALSRDSAILASGSEDGQLKIWRIQTGACVRKIERAHSEGITSIEFSREGSHVLTASLDHTARIHGLKSGRTLGTFRGHNAYVNTAVYSHDGSKVITGASDGKVKIWDSKTYECLQTMVPPPPYAQAGGGVAISVNRIFLAGKMNPDSFFVCTRSSTLYLLSFGGQVLKTFSSGKREGGEFVTATASPSFEWIYSAGEDKTIYAFSNTSGKLDHVILETHTSDIFGLAHHPHHSLLTSWGFDGALHMYKP